MLKLFYSSSQIDLAKLAEVYKESNRICGRERYPWLSHQEQLSRAEQDFFDYWRCDFYTAPEAVCAVWEVDGNYLSALRFEPYRDGIVLAGLETAPRERNKGFGSMLLREVIRHLRHTGGIRLYSHVSKHNGASKHIHESCGFSILSEYAVFLDGSVSQNYDTYFLQM